MTILNNRSIWQRIEAMEDIGAREAMREKYDYLARNPALSWQFVRRQDQIPPVDNEWDVWVYSGGRGAGKTRTGVEETCAFAESHPESRLLIIAPTRVAVRESIIEGESGIMARYQHPKLQSSAPKYSPAIRRLEWPNKSKAFVTNAEDLIDAQQEWGGQYSPLRGVQAHFTWIDEAASWKFPDDYDESDLTLWDEIRFGTRLGSHPRILVTTTPRDSVMTRAIHKNLQRDPVSVRLTEASTLSNTLGLSPTFVDALEGLYDGTELGKQEVNGQWPWKY